MTVGTSATRRIAMVAVAVVAVIAAAAAGVLGGLDLGDEPAAASPAEGSVDVGFLRDMQVHHAQAVQMSVIIRDRTTDVAVRRLALDILLSQQQQIGQMYGWLADWGLPQTSTAPPMQWMTDGSGGMPGMDGESMGSAGAMSMPGMATPADLARLRTLRDRDAERLYLQLMIPHHRGAISMAQYAVDNASDPQVRTLALRILEAQSAEIKALQEMLTARGGPLT